ncbi:sugar ABC transporter permease [Agrobacterium rhizogenes]|uniref:carbohydrate ABC transporter permease n=1 Tax=Rhizobium TaxID=379 RepID=UPI00026EE21D|nr:MULTISPECIES: sugar ABC transporter permease [Rhizobium]EJK87375.1 permease component of ABC-type sugar transporter [Rhizobium sp. AP16]NTF83842.1 sugar ABC transporter permease [Rhizobium rhizogenes]NTG43818.1 sugar ABC transporter permease [Rhizobium rhizogenes]NTH14977.1 sugar ABC transporter permease [Rhizobium rhizogenes]NTH21372.1 sugar ABC transporter permease [Rhizobium rhizogenes]
MLAKHTALNARPRPRSRKWFRGEGWTALFFLLPGLIGIFLFLVLPILASIALSFTNWQLLGTPRFVGFSNYTRLFTTDPQFWTVMRNTIFFTAEYLVLNIIISLGLATWISSLKIGQRWFRVVFFLPTFTPLIAVAIVWMLIFTSGGLFDSLMAQLSLPFSGVLNNRAFAMQAVIITSLWAGIGYNTVLFNAALDMVPATYLEAARIDGATAWDRFWKIRLPLISPTLFFGTVMTAITSLQVFDQIYVMTKGGPGSSTATLGYAIYQRGFQNFQMGYASAIAWVMFALIMALTALQFWLQRKWVHYDA